MFLLGILMILSCVGGACLLVTLTGLTMPWCCDRWGFDALMLIPASALAGVFLGWQALWLLF